MGREVARDVVEGGWRWGRGSRLELGELGFESFEFGVLGGYA